MRLHRRFAARAWSLCEEAGQFGFPNSPNRPLRDLTDSELMRWVDELQQRLVSLSKHLARDVVAGGTEEALLLRKVRRLTRAYRVGHIK